METGNQKQYLEGTARRRTAAYARMCFFRTASLQNLSLCVMILILQLTYVRNIRCKISDHFSGVVNRN